MLYTGNPLGHPRQMQITQKQFQLLIEAFRKQPSAIMAAARAADVSKKCAARAWHHGWPLDTPPQPPIKVLLEQEKAADAAAIAAKHAAVRQETEAFALSLRAETRDDALAAHEQEGKLVKAARQNVHNLAVVANAAVVLANKLITSAANDLMDSAKLDGMSPQQKAVVADKLTAIADRGVKLVQGVLEAERLWRGDPTKVIGVVPMEEMSVEEAKRLAYEAYEAAQLYERNGLEVIDGGAEAARGQVINVQAVAK
jgi:hypothetical protein